MSKFRLFGGGKAQSTLERCRGWAHMVDLAEEETRGLSDTALRRAINTLRQRHQCAHTALLAHGAIEVEDVATATIRFASGALAVLHATTAAYPGLSVRLQIHGSQGSAVLHDDQLEYFHVARHGSGTTAGPYGGTEPDNQAADLVPASELRGGPKAADAMVVGHLRQYEDVVEAIESGRAPGVTAQDGLMAVAIVRAVYVSAALGQTIDIDALLNGDYDDVAVGSGLAH